MTRMRNLPMSPGPQNTKIHLYIRKSFKGFTYDRPPTYAAILSSLHGADWYQSNDN